MRRKLIKNFGQNFRIYFRAPIILVILSLGLLTCGDLDSFEVEQSSTTMIPGMTPTEPYLDDLAFSDFANIDLAADETLASEDVRKNQIDAVNLITLSLTITAPASGQDLTFLSSIEFFIEAEGQPKERIAFGGPFQSGTQSAYMNIDTLDLHPYVAAETMSITTKIAGTRPQNTTTIVAYTNFLVDVDVSEAVCGAM